MALAMLAAWDDWDRRPLVIGNVRDKPWRARSPFPVYFVGYLAAAVCIMRVYGVGPNTLPALSLLEIAYLNFVVCHRNSPFAGRHLAYIDAAVVMLLCPVSYLLSPLADAPSTVVNEAAVLLGFVTSTNLPFLSRSWSALATSVTTGPENARTTMLWKAGLLVFGFAWHMRWCLEHGVLLLYFGSYAAVILTVYVATQALHKDWFFHLHHYLMGFFLVPACHMPNLPLSLLLAAFSYGQFVEGVTRWSPAPLWHRRNPPPSAGSTAAPLHVVNNKSVS